jgi:hypothetical protein
LPGDGHFFRRALQVLIAGSYEIPGGLADPGFFLPQGVQSWQSCSALRIRKPLCGAAARDDEILSVHLRKA